MHYLNSQLWWISLSLLFLSIFPMTTLAMDEQTINHHGQEMTQHGHTKKHGNENYFAFEILAAIGRTDNSEDFLTTDYHGWLGNDDHKLFVMGELERLDHETEATEFWFLYSRKVSEFWDLQFGWRYDSQPFSHHYLVVGFDGLAPFFIDTGLYASLSKDGDLMIRLHQRRDFLLSNTLILTPYLEIDASTKAVPERDLASGFGVGEFGIRLGYHANKKIAPYLDLRYERNFSDLATDEDDDSLIFMLGLQLLL